jgi:heme transport system substrate-binding protein
MRDPRSSLPAFAITIAIGCVFAATPASGDAVTVRDAAGRTVTIKDARRIVSVGGAVTEILYALGLEQRVVAVDTTSLYPPRALTEKPNVGYMRQLSPEGVLGLGPSLVLAAEGSGPKETIAVLEAASVPFVQIPDRFTGAGIVEKIRLIAQATDAWTAAFRLRYRPVRDNRRGGGRSVLFPERKAPALSDKERRTRP